MRSHNCPARKLLEKDNPSLAKNEQSCFCPSSLYEKCKEFPLSQIEGEISSSKEDVMASQTLSSSQLMKLYSHDHMSNQKKPIHLLQKDNQDLSTLLSGAQISKQSAECKDERIGYEKTTYGDPMLSNSRADTSEKQLNPSNGVVEQSGLYHAAKKMIQGGSVRTRVRKLPLFVDEHVSLTGASSATRLLNILNTFPPKVSISRPRKKLLILDINGILADVIYPSPKGYTPDTRISGRAVFTRPHCRDFLKFCLERFQVGIWSSRSKKLVDRILDYLIGDMKERLTFCWDISHCTASQFRTLENRHKVMVFKELKMLWEKQDSNLPWKRGDYNESNTVLLDDSPYKALLNPPHTAVFPYSFSFKDHADNSLGPQGKIRAYLEEVALSENAQEYIEKHPFGQSAITERSLSWGFYNKVIQGHCDTSSLVG